MKKQLVAASALALGLATGIAMARSDVKDGNALVQPAKNDRYAIDGAVMGKAELFGYISDLRSMTKGRASFTMQFHHYDPVPRNIADEIMAKSA